MLRSTEEDIQDIFGAECRTSRRKNDWLRSESFSKVNAMIRKLWQISTIFPQKESEDRPSPQFRDVFHPDSGRETRASRPVLQTALTLKSDRRTRQRRQTPRARQNNDNSIGVLTAY
jgi:hypothetical protein